MSGDNVRWTKRRVFFPMGVSISHLNGGQKCSVRWLQKSSYVLEAINSQAILASVIRRLHINTFSCTKKPDITK